MSKKNYTMTLETETIDRIKKFADSQDRSISFVTNFILKDGINGIEEENNWIDIAHGYEYENSCLKRENSAYMAINSELAMALSKFDLTRTDKALKDVIQNWLNKNISIIKEG